MPDDSPAIDLVATYDAMAERYGADAEDNAYNAHLDRPAVLELVGDVAGLRVLDAACGPGIYAAELVARGARLTAFDASREMVEQTRRRVAAAAVDLRVADLDDPLPYADGAFDLVVCALAIHYVRDRAATLRELHRVLAPGGRLVLSTQHPLADWLRKGGSYYDVREETDVWHRGDRAFTVRFWREPLTTLCAAIADAGFLIERLVEPLPAESMRERWPDDWEKLHERPAFLALRLVRGPEGV